MKNLKNILNSLVKIDSTVIYEFNESDNYQIMKLQHDVFSKCVNIIINSVT